jgi:hypothetical protein
MGQSGVVEQIEQSAVGTKIKSDNCIKVKLAGLSIEAVIDLANTLTMANGRCPRGLIQELEWRVVCLTERAHKTGARTLTKVNAELKQTLSQYIRDPDTAFDRIIRYFESDDIEARRLFLDEDFLADSLADLTTASLAVEAAIRRYSGDRNNEKMAEYLESEAALLLERIADYRCGLIWRIDPRVGRQRLNCRDNRTTRKRKCTGSTPGSARQRFTIAQ